MMARGKFITFEGIDGAGKTTHLAWFRERLELHIAPSGRAVVMTREPGGTALGESLREILLHQKMDLETEALLMFAARREHLAQVIEPALQRRDLCLSGRRPRPATRQAGSAGALGAGRFPAGPDAAVRRAARYRQ
jgi:dTMP kinase